MEIEAVAVAAGRVFWTTWDSQDAWLHSSYPAGDRRQMLRVDVSQYDWAFTSLWSSRERVVVQVDYTYSDPEEEYSGTVVQASGPVGARRAETLRLGDFDERIHDVDGHRVATTTVRVRGNRRTVSAFVRDLARPETPPRAVERVTGNSGADPQLRIAGRYLAILRYGRQPAITVVDLYERRTRWGVRLPRWWRISANAGSTRDIEWDIARSGTLAIALTTNTTSPQTRRHELGFAAPHGAYRRTSSRVALRQPFAFDGDALIYARPSGRNRVRVAQRRAGEANPTFLSGKIPGQALVASDGHTVAAVLGRVGAKRCVLAARAPVPDTASWRC